MWPSSDVTWLLGDCRSTYSCISLESLNQVPALIGWGKGGNVTPVRWQVTLCDPIWHVSSRNGEAYLLTAIHGYFTLRSSCLCVQLSARHGVSESFVLSLVPNPVSSVVSRARLSTNHVTCTIEPRGLMQFTQQSRDVTADVTGSLAQVLALLTFDSRLWYDRMENIYCPPKADSTVNLIYCA